MYLESFEADDQNCYREKDNHYTQEKSHHSIEEVIYIISRETLNSPIRIIYLGINKVRVDNIIIS